jgi:hypothetical protein
VRVKEELFKEKKIKGMSFLSLSRESTKKKRKKKQQQTFFFAATTSLPSSKWCEKKRLISMQPCFF